jgi:putative ABC transport system ATP-binding protein
MLQQGSSTPVREIAVKAADAVKIFGSGATAVTALDHVDVEFEARRFSAIMGPSGSGKSTLLHCLAGLDDLTAGQVFIGDTNVTVLDEKHRTLVRRDKIGFVFQSYNLVPTLTAEENILLPMALARRDPDRIWVDKLIETIEIADRLTHLPTELSGGQQQRVAVARALAGRPEIIFADEPTGNLDSHRGAELLSFMQRAVREFGQSIVMVTHDPVAATYADRVVFLQDGKIVDEMSEPNVEKILDKIKSLEG